MAKKKSRKRKPAPLHLSSQRPSLAGDEEQALKPNFVKLVDTNPLHSTGLVVRYWNSRGFPDLFRGFRTPQIRLPREAFESSPTNYALNEFGVRDIEFGNWLSQEDRFTYLASFIVAMHDLRLVLKPYNKTFGDLPGLGLLGISFGARGKSGALAHYEPDSRYVNLTRHRRLDKQSPEIREKLHEMIDRKLEGIKSPTLREKKRRALVKQYLMDGSSGISALAHEYGHFIDYVSAQMFSHGANKVKIRNSPVGRDTITGRDSKGQTLIGSRYKREIYRESPVVAVRLMGRVIETLLFQSPGSEKLSEFGERIDRISQREPYYGRHVEIWARTFEAWVHYELSKKHIVNTALTQFKYEAAVYPPAATMKKVAPIIRELIKHLTL